ncbi:stress response translation initiation inhibitor YciH [Alteromonas sp. C1M14]|uniref:stress response translation initiation inhibitor YciH n=1 Tax=Alteromonas sp. C1M14 TaxID=2841567 RepID=UPI001C08301D|nr:stress response translation initiation inhibitor YciH [Alteromonas sp. C1M14]MBU2977401.1 stress response translation initiation inhibitor YciH [Alteromonas sp. C1M14]
MQDSKLVYSTDGGRISQKSNAETRSVSNDGIIRIHRETKGRKGKGVSVIHGLDMDAKALKTLCTELKKKCGCGGAVKDGLIEVQTDDREKLKALLQQKKFTVKLAGG